KINVVGMKKIADYAGKLIQHLASEPARPEYVYVPRPFQPGKAKGPRLGIIPNYDSAQEGVLVGGVSDKGPAALAGLKKGDLIVDIAGKAVKNLQTYMVIMGQQRSGQALEVGVLRDGKKLTFKVVPQ